MRLRLCLAALPLALAACGSEPPPQPTPVVINTPPAQPVAPPTTPTQSGLVTECQGLFAQALNGQPVNYGSPAVASAGGSTTIRLVAQPVTAPPTPPMQYTCSFSGTTLMAAGMN
jgi:hypothetical protein